MNILQRSRPIRSDYNKRTIWSALWLIWLGIDHYIIGIWWTGLALPPPPPSTFGNGHNIDEQDNNREPLSDNINSSPSSLITDPCMDNHNGNEEYSFREEQNIPRAIKRLLPHNNPGQKEKTTAPENGRLTRSGKYL